MTAAGGATPSARAVQPGQSFDTAALDAYLRDHVPAYAGPCDIAQFDAGASNPTFLVTDRDGGQRYVLRKQPPGRLVAGAHAVDREYAVMRALAGTAVPVPAMLAYCGDAAVVGTPFYLMPFLDGRVYEDNRLADMTPGERRIAYRDVARVLAALHAVDPAGIGLSGFGRVGGYYQRQVARWTRQYRDSAMTHDAAMERLIAALPERLPADDRTTIVHGDCRQGNWMFAARTPGVLALLDWELSTLGHPLADLAYFCLFYHADFAGWGSNADIDFATSGIPDEARFIADYQAAGGVAIADWPFHLAFAAFRLAAIAFGVKRRAADGQTHHRGGDSAPLWAGLAARLLDEE